MSRVSIITGPIMRGKSTLAARLAAELGRRGLRVGGMVAKSLWRGDDRYGFDLVEPADGRVTPLARRQSPEEAAGPVPFSFSEAGMAAGRRALEPARCASCDVVFVDEVGKLEAAGGGWAPLLAPLLATPGPRLVWVVRLELVPRVCLKWHLKAPLVVDVSDENAYDVVLNHLLAGKDCR